MTSGALTQVVPILGTMALLGAALMGGTFFAFSSFVMKALGRLAPAEGVTAMQSINVVVLNPSFLGGFLGTAVLSLILSGLALSGLVAEGRIFFLAGAVLYLLGTFLVTAFGNVPLNNQLEAVAATDPGTAALWEMYLSRWTFWNHVRTLAALAATVCFSLGLSQGGAP